MNKSCYDYNSCNSDGMQIPKGLRWWYYYSCNSNQKEFVCKTFNPARIEGYKKSYNINQSLQRRGFA